jgi:hypothetical protein
MTLLYLKRAAQPFTTEKNPVSKTKMSVSTSIIVTDFFLAHELTEIHISEVGCVLTPTQVDIPA